MMEQHQEHIATLCAIGTVGVAAAGLAFGTSTGDAFLIKPGKRKTPGGDAIRSPVTTESPFPTRRAVSQPHTPSMNLHERVQRPSTSSIFRRKTVRDSDQKSTNGSLLTHSRGSSMNRLAAARPWTRDAEQTSEQKESTPGQSWLRRISSSLYGNSPGSSVSGLESSPAGSRSSQIYLDRPNKLVKRSLSRRALSSETPQSQPLQRPPSSHQLSQTFSPSDFSPSIPSDAQRWPGTHHEGSAERLWQPFFDNGYQRKRRTSGVYDTTIRTISAVHRCTPTLVKGNAVQPRDVVEDVETNATFSSPLLTNNSTPTTRRQKLRRSLGSVRRPKRMRTFTEPIVNTSHEEAFGSILPVTKASPLSPVSQVSTFDIDLPRGAPSLVSSSPSMNHQPRFFVNKRISVAPSDPTTISSDNDTKVFTDDDSMDFHSDTAYDSLATRATASSHSGFRQPKIETIFDEVVAEQGVTTTETIEKLMLNSRLEDPMETSLDVPDQASRRIGIGITGIEGHDSSRESFDPMSTPVKRMRQSSEELMATPVPVKTREHFPELPSSPPSVVMQHYDPEDMAPGAIDEMDIDTEDNIEWSPKSDRDLSEALLRTVPSSPVLPNLIASFGESTAETNSNKRSSIFDWSENQKYPGEAINGSNARPRTVHGKQGKDANRSRPSVRKPPNNKHMRSQSVPVNRDIIGDADLPPSTNKFGTWGLGNKPVSEEWSDDFEFEDIVETDDKLDLNLNKTAEVFVREAVQTVKIPQSIIDRQQSVHLQFGQVQEFMLLVEELKRLKVQGSALQLLDGQSRQLWDDAECIINLATLNDEEDDEQRPNSPTSSDIFAEDLSPVHWPLKDSVLKNEDTKRASSTRRSISNSATPPSTRPRGESLAQAKSFLQTMHQTRAGPDSSPAEIRAKQREKLPFDTQDLRDLVVRTAVITRALKDIVRKAEGVSVSPSKSPPRFQDPAFSQIFNPPGASPCPPFRKPGLPKSRSAHSYLDSTIGKTNENEIPSPRALTAVVEAN